MRVCMIYYDICNVYNDMIYIIIIYSLVCIDYLSSSWRTLSGTQQEVCTFYNFLSSHHITALLLRISEIIHDNVLRGYFMRKFNLKIDVGSLHALIFSYLHWSEMNWIIFLIRFALHVNKADRIQGQDIPKSQ